MTNHVHGTSFMLRSSIPDHWPTVWTVARPEPDHRVNSPCSPRSANQAGASPSRSIPAVAATFAVVALAASAETAHQPGVGAATGAGVDEVVRRT